MHFSSSYAGSDTIPHYIFNVRFSDSELGSKYLAQVTRVGVVGFEPRCADTDLGCGVSEGLIL
jgi:hypothetical protein